MRQVIEFYGIKTERNGLCLCPFHNDTHPSMKIYEKSFYCWVCGTGGDLISFASNYHNLKNEEACLQLIHDFCLPNPLEEISYREKRERIKRNEKRKILNEFVKSSQLILKTYWQLLCNASRDPNNIHFCEALQELSIIEYRLECLKKYPEEYYNDKKAVKKIGEIEGRIADWYGCIGAG
jgi:hypothetical protein